jgi:hypothetical protein
MNCVTFVARFLFFHYVLFATKDDAPAVEAVPVPTGAEATAGMQTPGHQAPAPAGHQTPAPAELARADAAHGSDTGPMALVAGDSGPPRS